MKKDVDGINDEYEELSEFSNPKLDLDDNEDETQDTDFLDDGAFDILHGDFDVYDVFEMKNSDTQSSEGSFDITGDAYSIFSVWEKDDEKVEDSLDMTFENAPEAIEQPTLPDSRAQNNSEPIGDFTPPKPRIKAKKKINGGIVLSTVVCSLLILFLIWTLIGTIYTNKYNSSVYEDFLNGADVEAINHDFMFFMTFNGKAFPVINSDTPNYYKAFNGSLFAPGTLTSSDGSTVTGSPKLLSSINQSLIGERITIETHDQKTEYEVYSVGVYNPENTYDSLTIFVADKSSETGYTAVFTKPVE